ncbi:MULTISPECIES: CHRD domain-containing protein [Natrialbaceae]|uniref:CHRD domain-containing protein n=1 Tax=Natrialbaceae TaxID=1644061 RepID=UPI00207C121C|nr:CHRD domain-containing protein [Natronococcus sp. CG52]
MKRRELLQLGAGALALTQVPVAFAQDDENFDAAALFSAGAMTGDQQEPPLESDGVGTAVFSLSQDETKLHYVLLVTELEEITQAHIHAGKREGSGDVVAFLFGQRDESGEFTGEIEGGVTFNGVLANGTITEDALLGPFKDESFQTLVDAIRDEETYANVHTVEHPDGEIRGQLLEVQDIEVQFDGMGDVWHEDGQLHTRPDSGLMIRENDEIIHHHYPGIDENDDRGRGPNDARGRGRDDHHRRRRSDDSADEEE